ncbi:hypothetical protein CGSMWGv00703Bmash_04555 [Gardnerella pickettii 00703Bmash]|nr:hypothetical protein CGSMWGv00703Bmash_04555 [Gardnerella pickettii 00703Bmash]
MHTLIINSTIVCAAGFCLNSRQLSSYIMPNHHTNANANSGDFVSEIVENTTSGLNKNVIITAARKAIGVVWIDAVAHGACPACDSPVLALAHGVFKNRFAVAAQQNAASTNCITASNTIPASFDSVK